jgi:hypothetical protein
MQDEPEERAVTDFFRLEMRARQRVEVIAVLDRVRPVESSAFRAAFIGTLKA